jgi:hypothetical protein
MNTASSVIRLRIFATSPAWLAAIQAAMRSRMTRLSSVMPNPLAAAVSGKPRPVSDARGIAAMVTEKSAGKRPVSAPAINKCNPY